MTNLKFYTVFSIFNIIIVMLILAGMYTLFISVRLFVDGPMLYFYCIVTIYFLYIAYKLLLPKIFVKITKKYKNSIIGEFAQHLHDNPQKKWKILSLAFCFDIPIILYLIDIYKNHDVLSRVLFSYFILYAGGVFLFYIMLYEELKNYEK